MICVVLKPSPQAAHVHPQVFRLLRVFRTPNGAEQDFVQDDSPGVLDEGAEQLVLGCRKIDERLTSVDLAGSIIDRELSDFQRRSLQLSLRDATSPYRCTDAREQLAHPKRLREIIVRADVQRLNFIALLS